MNQLTDVLLHRPIADPWSRWLLFFLFFWHLLFILILIGTAMIGVQHFLHSYWTKEEFEHRWDKKVLKKFIIPKEIGVVIGVGALLVVQVYFTVPFYTATSLFAPFWLGVIVVMIVGFFSIDGISHKMDVHPVASLVLGVLGLLLVLAIPAIFVLVLVVAENSDKWVGIVRNGFRLDGSLALHWLTRYLHVVGASMVFGAAFHYLVTAEDHQYRKSILVRWLLAGLLVQFVTGGLLAMTLQEWITPWVLLPLGVGILAAAVLVWIYYFRREERVLPHLGYTSMILLPLLLGSMLLARQFIQQQKVLPVLKAVEANAADYRRRLRDLRPQQVAAYAQQLRTERLSGASIYERSCSFCHGRTGMGDGEESGNLLVQPERIVHIRATPGYLRNQVAHGVPGSAMPYFTIYEEPRLEALLSYLDERFGVFGAPGDVPVRLSPQELREGSAIYYRTCVLCHGMNGEGGEYARGLSPSPPDFRSFSPAQERAFEVVSQGYRGTAMPSFGGLAPNLRWALIRKIYDFRTDRGRR